MRTEAQIHATLTAIRAALPKAGPAPERVEIGEISAKRGMLRVVLMGAPGSLGPTLVGEWGHGAVGWVQVESGAYLGTEGARVYRAVLKALKADA